MTFIMKEKQNYMNLEKFDFNIKNDELTFIE